MWVCRIDQKTLLLGDAEVRVVDLIAATLHRVAAEAARIAGAPPGRLDTTSVPHAAGRLGDD